MAGSQVDFANAREVRRALRNLEVDFVKFPAYFQKRWIRNALKSAVEASELLNRYQAAAPVDSGNLKKSATIVNGNLRSGPQKGHPYARVGYGRSKGRRGYHAHWMADGTAPRYSIGRGLFGKKMRRGRIKPNPALQALQSVAERIGAIAMDRYMLEAMEKANRQWNSPKYQARAAAWAAKRNINL